MAKRKEVMVTEFGPDVKGKSNPHIDTDRMVIENLIISYGTEAERAWRYYNRSGVLPQISKNDKGVVDPDYVPCPAPVKIDKNGGWTADNCKRCNATIPHNKHGRSARVWAQAHMEIEHGEDWVDMHSFVDNDNRNGHKSPPQSAKVELPKWAVDEDDLRKQEMTESEKELDRQKREMRQSKSSKANITALNEKRKQEKLQAESKEAMVVGESETE